MTEIELLRHDLAECRKWCEQQRDRVGEFAAFNIKLYNDMKRIFEEKEMLETKLERIRKEACK